MTKPTMADAKKLVAESGDFDTEKGYVWVTTPNGDPSNPTSSMQQTAAFKAKLVELEAEYDAQLYARNRKPEYDALNQFELMTDDAANSTTAHADAIAVIKTKWPKDNSGPVE